MNTRHGRFLLAGMLASVSLPAHPATDIVADEVVVTASRFETKTGDHPIGTTIITGDDIRASGETSLPRLLGRQPGIIVRDNSGSPDLQVDLRGFGVTGDQNTLVLLDGRRLSEHELLPVQLSSIPLESIERIEIVRGSGAVLYGGGATAGVINVVTKGPTAGARSFDAYAGFGSYDTQDYRLGAKIAGDSVGLELNGGRYISDNYRENNHLRQANLVADLRNFDPDRTVDLKLGYEQQDLRLPGNRTEAELQTDRRGTRTPSDFSNRTDGFASMTGTFTLSDAQLIADLSYREKNNDFHAAFAGLSLDGNTRVQTWSFSPRLKIPYSAFGLGHSVVVGLDREDWNYTSMRTNPAAAAAQQHNSAAYLQNVLTLAPATTVSIGGRLQRTEFSADDTSTTAVSGEQNRNVSAYEIGARHQFSGAGAIYAKYGYSFRTATLDEVYAPGLGAFFIAPAVVFLEPQTSHDAELGLELQSTSVKYRIAVHQSLLANEIHFDSTTFANVNLPPTKRSGVELEAKWMLTKSVSLWVNYSYLDARFRSAVLDGIDVSGNRIPLVPRHVANSGIDWSASERTRLNASVNYVGTQLYDGDESNTFGRSMPSFWSADISVFHTVDAWTFGATVRNVFDEKYYSYALAIAGPVSTFVAYPAPERNFLVSAQYRFGR